VLITETIRQALQLGLQHAFPQLFTPAESAPDVALEEPSHPSFGDLSSPVCLKLARTLRANPLQLAQKLAETLSREPIPGVAEVNVTPPGYVNFRFDYEGLAQLVINQVGREGDLYGSRDAINYTLFIFFKVVIEHTNINPNKAAHIGHLRNACLGDTLARILTAVGYEVEVQNYIDDTGTAVADIVVGYELLGWQEDERSFDYFCWDLYTAINEEYAKKPELKKRQLEVLHSIEEGIDEIALQAKKIAERIVVCHLKTMARLGIFYNLLTWESHILQLGFWKHALSSLQGSTSLVLEQDGPNVGCWVVRLKDHPEFAGMENPDKVLVRSNGTATYVAKDIAYQMWKFGILGKDFSYAPYGSQENGATLWTSVLQGGETGAFGGANKVINVIDIRQKYLQDVLRVSLGQLGYQEQAANSVHFAYELVVLSAEAAKELGVVSDEEEEKDMYAMAGRKGIGVKADDLVELVWQKATQEVARRSPGLSTLEQEKLGLQIAVAAIRYYMQRYNMNTLIRFDFAEALNMQGNSGPYLQYAHARAHNILERAASRGLYPAKEIVFPEEKLNDSEKVLLRRIAALPEVLLKAAGELAPSTIAEYAYQLAASFMAFYEASPVTTAPPAVATFRLSLVAAYKQALANSLQLLGIPALNRM